MATIIIDEPIAAQNIKVSIGIVGFNLATKDATIRLTTPGKPRSDVFPNMLETYQGLTTDQKNTLNMWYRHQIALGMNIQFGTSYTWVDIPDTIFDPEPVDPPEEP